MLVANHGDHHRLPWHWHGLDFELGDDDVLLLMPGAGIGSRLLSWGFHKSKRPGDQYLSAKSIMVIDRGFVGHLECQERLIGPLSVSSASLGRDSPGVQPLRRLCSDNTSIIHCPSAVDAHSDLVCQKDSYLRVKVGHVSFMSTYELDALSCIVVVVVGLYCYDATAWYLVLVSHLQVGLLFASSCSRRPEVCCLES